jgi:glucan 1,3-beta-glucosidase
MRRAAAFLLLSLLVVGFWLLVGAPRPLPAESPAVRERLACLSYAPFEQGQSPFTEGLVIPPEQIERQVQQLAQFTRCLRSYSVGQGLDALPAAAERAGLTVLLGIWLGRDAVANEREIARALELAAQYPATIEALVVGNEVLLRKEMTFEQLAALLDRVRAASALPITYADVWENWAATPELARHVDFSTIHILPYWEDEPVAIDGAVEHVAAVRRAMERHLPGVDILIGETGWPAVGRQRQGAAPSRLNQANYLYAVLDLFHREGWRYNLIEAFDQDWKRLLEGTVGGHWGLFDGRLERKFVWGGELSDHPIGLLWIVGLAIALAVLAIAPDWRGFALAAVTGLAVPWWLEQAPLISLDAADWLRAALATLLGLALPPLAALALRRDLSRPTLASLLGPVRRPAGWLAWSLGIGLVLGLALALPWALGLVFDPRYRDFPTAALAPALAGLAVLPRPAAAGHPEAAFAAALAVSAAVTCVNEGLENVQSLAWCLTLAIFAARLWPSRGPARGAPA